MSRFKALRSAACATLCLLGVGTATAAVLDQVSPFFNSSFAARSGTSFWQQEVRVGITGQLDSVDIYLQGEQPGAVDFSINRGTGWQTDANDFQVLYTAGGTGWHSIDVSGAALQFAVGDMFVIGLLGTGEVLEGFGGSGFPGLYGDGRLFHNATVFDQLDIAFQTNITPVAAIPEPDTYAMMAIGLGLLGWVGRRKKLKEE